MADTKISALTAATTPLAGTEVLPIVQSGVTKQVSVANLTAGRAVSADSLTLTNALTAANGGTGQSSYAIGDLLYASASTTLSKLADVATGNALISGGVGVAPSWGKIGLTTHVSGTLGVTNGGTGTATAFTAGSVVFAGASGVYSQNNANFFWDNTNNRLGLGTSAPVTKADVIDNATYQLHLASSTSNYSNAGLYMGALGTSDPDYYGYIIWDQATETYRIGTRGPSGIGGLAFYTNAASAPVERGRFDTAGRFLVGVTATDSGAMQRFKFDGSASQNGLALFDSSSTSGTTFQIFQISGPSNIGTITRDGATSAVKYNTTSDYRIKNVIGPYKEALKILQRLKVYEGSYKGDDDVIRPLLLAHEVQSEIPHLVDGVKDGVDQNGKEIYQQLNYQGFVPFLISAINELSNEINDLKIRLESKGV